MTRLNPRKLNLHELFPGFVLSLPGSSSATFEHDRFGWRSAASAGGSCGYKEARALNVFGVGAPASSGASIFHSRIQISRTSSPHR